MAKPEPLKRTAARRVIQAAGGFAALAHRVGITRQAILGWHNRGVPQDRIDDVKRILGPSWTARDIRPDLYP